MMFCDMIVIKLRGMGSPSSSSTVNPQWLVDRAQFVVMDTKIGESMDNTLSKIHQLATRVRCFIIFISSYNHKQT